MPVGVLDKPLSVTTFGLQPSIGKTENDALGQLTCITLGAVAKLWEHPVALLVTVCVIPNCPQVLYFKVNGAPVVLFMLPGATTVAGKKLQLCDTPGPVAQGVTVTKSGGEHEVGFTGLIVKQAGGNAVAETVMQGLKFTVHPPGKVAVPQIVQLPTAPDKTVIELLVPLKRIAPAAGAIVQVVELGLFDAVIVIVPLLHIVRVGADRVLLTLLIVTIFVAVTVVEHPPAPVITHDAVPKPALAHVTLGAASVEVVMFGVAVPENVHT